MGVLVSKVGTIVHLSRHVWSLQVKEKLEIVEVSLSRRVTPRALSCEQTQAEQSTLIRCNQLLFIVVRAPYSAAIFYYFIFFYSFIFTHEYLHNGKLFFGAALFVANLFRSRAASLPALYVIATVCTCP